MSLWFAGAFNDTVFRPSTSRRMASKHPNDQSACMGNMERGRGGGGIAVGSGGRHGERDGDFFWFGGIAESSGGGGIGGRRRANSAAPTLGLLRVETHSSQLATEGRVSADDGNLGSASRATEAPYRFAEHQHANIVFASGNDEITPQNVHRHVAAHSLKESTRFLTPHRRKAVERGYDVNPITLQPTTRGPSRIPEEIQVKFDSDSKRRDFYAQSSDDISNLRGVRSPATNMEKLMDDSDNGQIIERDLEDRGGAQQRRRASSVGPTFGRRAPKNYSEHYSPSFNCGKREHEAKEEALFSTSSSAYGRHHSVGRAKTEYRDDVDMANAYTPSRQQPQQKQQDDERGTLRVPPPVASASHERLGEEENGVKCESYYYAAAAKSSHSHALLAPSTPRRHHRDAVSQEKPFLALNFQKTILYPDHKKEEQVFLQGSRKHPIIIPSVSKQIKEDERVYERQHNNTNNNNNERRNDTDKSPFRTTSYARVRDSGNIPYDTEFTADSSFFYNNKVDGSPARDVQLRTQKKLVPVSEGRRSILDEDNFILKTSRLPPPHMTDQSEKEGFAILLSSDPARLRSPLDGMRMVEKRGKVTSDFEQRTAESRLGKEQQILLERRERCMKAFEAERLRMATRKTHDTALMCAADLGCRRRNSNSFIVPSLGKGRAHTPVAAAAAAQRGAPFALDMAAPHAASVGKSTPWWKR